MTQEKSGMKEIRVGLVLYGGVSLAVYINGVTTELWHLLRASRARQNKSERDKLDGTAEIYAELLDKLERLTGNDLRVVVDTVAGSSAGGINGATLAKAIVDGGDASIVNDLWIEDANISKLRTETVTRLPCFWSLIRRFAAWALKDWSSKNIPCLSLKWLLGRIYVMVAKPKGEPELTLLKGDYFTRMIARVFREMEKGSGEPLLTKRGSFDLYITRTDVYGWPRHLPVSEDLHDGTLYEGTHAHVMRFRRKPRGGRLDDDFGLTYAARSTGSFPLAFPPINYEDISTVYQEERPGAPVPTPEKFGRDHLPEHRLSDLPAKCVWMMDGGVLDNKPFSYVGRAIERKAAEHEVYRAVVYVEPNPKEKIESEATEHVPNPLQVGDRLFDLLTHEPIYEDLRKLRDRNAKVARIRAFLDAQKDYFKKEAKKAGERWVKDGKRCPLAWPPDPTDVKKWQEATNSFAAKDSLSGYPGYTVLKARSAVRFLANVICRALDYPYESRQAFFVRRLMRAWFERKDALRQPVLHENEGYVLEKAQLSLLKNFDVPFRLRRLRTLVRATNEKYGALNGPGSKSGIGRSSLDAFKSRLEEITDAFQSLEEDCPWVKKTILNSFRNPDIHPVIDEAVKDTRFDTHRFMSEHAEKIEQLCESLSERFRRVSNEQNAKMIKALQDLPNDEKVRKHILETFATFPFADLTAFPLMDAADVEDLIDVNVMRISPLDVPREGKPPLKSRGMYSFKGFFCKAARKHDIKLGRLDGAHRLIDLVMEAADNERRDGVKTQTIRCGCIKQLADAIEKSVNNK